MAEDREVPSTSRGKSSQHCCVPCCTSDYRYDQSLHFHAIPKDTSLKKQWIIKIRRDEGPLFKISKSTVVCSKHFTKEDYKSLTPVRRRLKPEAVPSVFNWAAQVVPRRSLKRKILADADIQPKKRVEQEVTAAAEPPANANVQVERDELLVKQEKIDHLERQLEEQRNENKLLQSQLKLERFGISRFMYDNTLISFYTGFSSYMVFIAFFNCILPTAQNMQSAYYQGSETASLAGRKRNMLLIDECFMFFCRLKAGLLEQDLSVRFNCSLATVSRKIVTWANFMYFVLGSIPIWLPKASIQKLKPECFKSLYPRTRVIIDCTELRTQQPSSLVLNSQSFSNYKGANTFKCLLGIAPHGAVTFVSSLYTGCMSDVEITKLSGLLDLIEPGDDIMADKGFTLRKILAEKGATINIPDFLSKKKQFSVSEIENTEQIAKLRINIERMNRRIKENHLFDTPIPLSLSGTVNQLWTVACSLANFKGALVQAWSE